MNCIDVENQDKLRIVLDALSQKSLTQPPVDFLSFRTLLQLKLDDQVWEIEVQLSSRPDIVL